MSKKKSKKAANGDGSIYPLPNGMFKVAVTIPRSGGKRLKATAPTRDMARVERDRLRKEAREGVPTAGKMTVGEVLDLFLASETFSENTIASYTNAKNNLGDLVNRPIAKLTPLEISTWIASAKKSMGGRACELAVLRLRKACEYALELDLIVKSPFKAKVPRSEPKEIQPFSDDEAAKIVKAAALNPMGGVVVLAIGCGMRQGEIFGLQWGDVDWDAGCLRICRQVTECKGSQIVKAPKTKKGTRRVNLPAIAIETLKRQQAECFKQGRAKLSDWVFPSRTGTPFRRTNYARRHWKPLLKTLKIHPPRGLHAGRHTTATLLLMRNIPVIAVSEMLGHSRPSITHDTYAHYAGGSGKDAAAAMDSVLGCTAVAPKRRSHQSRVS